jgi:hypothetical protein
VLCSAALCPALSPLHLLLPLSLLVLPFSLVPLVRDADDYVPMPDNSEEMRRYAGEEAALRKKRKKKGRVNSRLRKKRAQGKQGDAKAGQDEEGEEEGEEEGDKEEEEVIEEEEEEEKEEEERNNEGKGTSGFADENSNMKF